MQKMISKLFTQFNVLSKKILIFHGNKTLYKSPVLILFINVGCSKSDDNEEPEIIDLPPCDSTLVLDDAVPFHGALALDLCKHANNPEGTWGLISARYIRANGTQASYSPQIGIMNSFGTNLVPKKGGGMLVLSTGRARTPSQIGACGNQSCVGYGLGVTPPGFPQMTTGCPEPSSNIYDDIGFEMVIKAPKTARGFSVDFNYYTFEYPNLVCTAFNDQFAILMDPVPVGALDGNIAIGQNNLPITSNSNYISIDNNNFLVGTGFDIWGSAANTGWIRAYGPVNSEQEFRLRFIIWDTGDNAIDATVILDNFRWLTVTPDTGTFKL